MREYVAGVRVKCGAREPLHVECVTSVSNRRSNPHHGAYDGKLGSVYISGPYNHLI